LTKHLAAAQRAVSALRCIRPFFIPGGGGRGSIHCILRCRFAFSASWYRSWSLRFVASIFFSSSVALLLTMTRGVFFGCAGITAATPMFADGLALLALAIGAPFLDSAVLVLGWLLVMAAGIFLARGCSSGSFPSFFVFVSELTGGGALDERPSNMSMVALALASSALTPALHPRTTSRASPRTRSDGWSFISAPTAPTRSPDASSIFSAGTAPQRGEQPRQGLVQQLAEALHLAIVVRGVAEQLDDPGPGAPELVAAEAAASVGGLDGGVDERERRQEGLGAAERHAAG
jgi:hypothetical protein